MRQSAMSSRFSYAVIFFIALHGRYFNVDTSEMDSAPDRLMAGQTRRGSYDSRHERGLVDGFERLYLLEAFGNQDWDLGPGPVTRDACSRS
jgi:hypothetical protein